MNRQEILNAIQNLKSREQVIFQEGTETVSNRFDVSEGKPLTIPNKETLISYELYSWIANAVFFKGKGCAKKGEELFSSFFSQIVSDQETDIQKDAEAERTKAIRILHAFMFNTEKVMMPDLLSSLAPLVLLDFIRKEKENGKEYSKTFRKNREIIFNQALLFTRSLFHSFLTLPNINPMKIGICESNLSNGLFLYEDTLFIPTFYNAFTLNGFRFILEDGLKHTECCLKTDSIKKLTVIYMAKDILASYIIAE